MTLLLDKRNLNTEIIKLRHELKKSKSLVTRRLLRKVNSLRKIKSKSELNEKNKRKVDRIFEEVRSLKQLDTDKTIKFCLITPIADCLKIISDEKSTKLQKVSARLRLETNFNNKIQDLSIKYKNWNSLGNLLTQKKKHRSNNKINRNESKKQDNEKEIDAENDTSTDDEKEIEAENNTSSDEEKGDSDNEVDSKDDECSGNEQEESISEEDSSEEVNDVEDESLSEEEKEEIQITSKDIKLQKFKGVEKEKVESKTNNVNKSTGVGIVRRITNLEELEKLDTFQLNQIPDISREKNRSSFFIGGVDEESDGEESDREEPEQLQKFNRVYHSRSKTDDKPASNFRKKPEEIPKFRKKSEQFNSIKNKKSEFNFNVKPSINNVQTKDEKLHPSWEARKRLKETMKIDIVPQNKKIKFS